MFTYAIIGFGGIARLHLSNLDKIAKKRKDFCLKAICGTTAEAFKKSTKINLGTVDVSEIDISNCNFYDDYKELIDKEKPDFILSALPTYLHEEVAIYALSRGIHVFSEKPMALTVEGCENMIRTAKENNVRLMIGHSQRFKPAFLKLKEYVDKGTYGKAYRAEFHRYSAMPKWTWNNWILNPELSGGCVFDFHIHDIDLIKWFFGMPKSLNTVITDRKVERESVHTQLYYDGLTVLANADWSLPQSYPFDAHCMVNFDDATVVVEGDVLKVFTDDGIINPELSDEDCFMTQIKAFIAEVIDNKPCDIISCESICESVSLTIKEAESAEKNQRIEF